MDMMEEVNQYAALVEQIAELQKKADEMHQRVKIKAAMKVRAIMAEHQLTDEQVLSGWGNTAKAQKPKMVRYRNEAGDTWSGVGRAPQWIASAPDRNVFLVGS